jgi:hypothetical protein
MGCIIPCEAGLGGSKIIYRRYRDIFLFMGCYSGTGEERLPPQPPAPYFFIERWQTGAETSTEKGNTLERYGGIT